MAADGDDPRKCQRDEDDEEEARKWFEGLRRLSAAQRLERIEREAASFDGPTLVARLLAESRSQLPENPEESGVWARAAVDAILASPGEQPGFLVLAIAYQANADRVMGARGRAEEGFRRAREIAARHRLSDRRVSADLDQLQASLLIDLRRFAEAEELLANAAMSYGLLRRFDSLARTLIKLSNLYTESGRLGDAIEADRSALEILDPKEHPKLYLFARFNLSTDLAAIGRHQEARDLLAFDADLYERHGDPSTLLRVRWLEGRIAHALGDAREAERAFLDVRNGFSERGNGFDVASVSLDLALLYFEQRRFTELRDVSTTAVALFEAQAVHRDALAALVMLRNAVLAEAVTSGTLRRVADYLEELRRNPSAHFDQPS